MYLENIDDWKTLINELNKTDVEEFLFAIKKFEVEFMEAKKFLERADCDISLLNEKNLFSAHWDIYQLCDVPKKICEVIRQK